MKSSGPWNLRGLRPEAREAAREAARRSGMSVGEWLNTVIRPADEDDEWSADFSPEPEELAPLRRRRNDQEREQYPSADRRLREPDDYWAQSRRQESRRQDSRRQDDRETESRRETNVRRRDRNRNDEPPIRPEGAPYREEHRGYGQPYYEEPRRERAIQSRREREHPRQNHDESFARPRHEPPVFEPLFEPADERPAPNPRNERASPGPAENDRDLFVDQAVAEITARQRALDAAVEISGGSSCGR